MEGTETRREKLSSSHAGVSYDFGTLASCLADVMIDFSRPGDTYGLAEHSARAQEDARHIYYEETYDTLLSLRKIRLYRTCIIVDINHFSRQ